MDYTPKLLNSTLFALISINKKNTKTGNYDMSVYKTLLCCCCKLAKPVKLGFLAFLAVLSLLSG